MTSHVGGGRLFAHNACACFSMAGLMSVAMMSAAGNLSVSRRVRLPVPQPISKMVRGFNCAGRAAISKAAICFCTALF